MKACATREHAMKEPFYEGEVNLGVQDYTLRWVGNSLCHIEN
jgi:hypothetical protein